MRIAGSRGGFFPLDSVMVVKRQLAFYPFSDYLFQFVEMAFKEMAAVFDYM